MEKRIDFNRGRAQDLELVILGKEDDSYLGQVFEQCPQLSLNRGNYQNWFSNPSSTLYGLIAQDKLVATLGSTRDYQLTYKNMRDENSQIKGTYLSAFWANRHDASSALLDYVIATEEHPTTPILGTISDRFLVKHPEWALKLPQYYLKRGFELIGHSMSHNGPVIKKGWTMNIKETYQQYARAYDHLTQYASLYKELNNAHVNSILQHTKIGDLVLDFGAGTGNASKELLISGRRVDAVDISQDMLQILREKCSKISGLETFQVDILKTTTLDSKKYSAVNMMNVIYHLENPTDYLRRIYALTTENAVIAVSGPHTNIDVDALFKEFKRDFVENGKWKECEKDFETCYAINKTKLVPNAKLYGESELKEIFRGVGFKQCLFYSQDFYNKHNYFALFSK